MNSVADFKREIKVGTRIHTVHHCKTRKDENDRVVYRADGLPEVTDEDMGEAPVSIVQTTQFAIARTLRNGEVRDSWMTFPKASMTKFEGNKIVIFEQDERRGKFPLITYTILP